MQGNKLFAQTQISNDIDVLKLHLIETILSEPAQEKQIEALKERLQESGSFSDIDYTNRQRSAWPVRDHLDRLLLFAKVYRTEGSPYYQHPSCSDQIQLMLNYWLDHVDNYPNWYNVKIYVPKILSAITVLMQEELSETQIYKINLLLDKATMENMTGQNKVWAAGIAVNKGVIRLDKDLIQTGVKAIEEEITLGKEEGIQFDYSYHQHGPQMQMGTYGVSFTQELAFWIKVLQGTTFDFSEEKKAIVRDFFGNGLRWVIYQDQMDVTALGRQQFHDFQFEKTNRFKRAFQMLFSADTAFAHQFPDFNITKGNKYFWHSDFMVHRTSDYYTSLKMVSERIIGSESGNGDNVKGYYLSDGATYFYRKGDEYLNVFPFWDWNKIPGTTTLQHQHDLPTIDWGSYRVDFPFAGGVSNGEIGVAAFQYDRDSLNAKKAYFYFDSAFVFLGTDIRSERNGQVLTTVNQSLLHKKGLKRIKNSNGQAILHDGFGYFFPKDQPVHLAAKKVKGRYSNYALSQSSEILKAKTFLLYLDHGQHPASQAYRYMVFPDCFTKEELSKRANQYHILQNDSLLQSVVNTKTQAIAMVFHQAGKLKYADKLGIEVIQPCIVLLENGKENLRLHLSDPTQKLELLTVMLDGHYSTSDIEAVYQPKEDYTILKIKLPNAGFTGTTTSIALDKIPTAYQEN
ncbi:polysaccharide lyase family 8 super-sandwich domain-containing protein [Limibacter armeniacum]|uniref:polysaccharide lyase family 8 super-sandwich domain-containing protein n=1 Tax=Limibacter armeniacum TaxID=466084 RepID=UPI002FE6B1CE